MNRLLLTLTVVLGAIAFALACYLFVYKEEASVPIRIETDLQETRTYASLAYNISFEYSPSYYLKERNADSRERPHLSIVLVENTQENRDVLEGRSTTARDGPVAITIDVYPNPDELSAENWMPEDTNWTGRTSEAAPIGRGQITGVTYSWSGLYEGMSVIVTEDSRAYVFSVTWLTPEDPILSEFDQILESVRVGP